MSLRGSLASRLKAAEAAAVPLRRGPYTRPIVLWNLHDGDRDGLPPDGTLSFPSQVDHRGPLAELRAQLDGAAPGDVEALTVAWCEEHGADWERPGVRCRAGVLRLDWGDTRDA